MARAEQSAAARAEARRVSEGCVYPEFAERVSDAEDAWRGPSNPPPPGPRPGESARDAYIRNLQSAYRTPRGQVVSDPDGEDDDPRAKANAIEAQRRRWTAETPAKDAAIADRDTAYGEYLDYLQNAWKRPCGVVAGGRR